jgi:hypothetical protein
MPGISIDPATADRRKPRREQEQEDAWFMLASLKIRTANEYRRKRIRWSSGFSLRSCEITSEIGSAPQRVIEWPSAHHDGQTAQPEG